MTDWKSPIILQQNALSLAKLVHALLGVYAWEWVISLDFDVAVLQGKRKFRWPLFVYFCGRYGCLATLICFCLILDSPTSVNCSIGHRVLAFFGGTGLGLSTLNLSTQIIALWANDRRIAIPLLGLVSGHFAIILSTVANVDAISLDGHGCAAVYRSPQLLKAMFAYTMIFQFILLALAAHPLLLGRKNSDGSKGHIDRIPHLLFDGGLVYFLVALLSNVAAAIMHFLDLNSSMTMIADYPAITMSTIAACRVVRNMKAYSKGNREQNSEPSPSSIHVISHPMVDSTVEKGYHAPADSCIEILYTESSRSDEVPKLHIPELEEGMRAKRCEHGVWKNGLEG